MRDNQLIFNKKESEFIMVETFLDVLVYLVENYISCSKQKSINTKIMTEELMGAGFTPFRIHFAIDWLENLYHLKNDIKHLVNIKSKAYRILTVFERKKLTLEAYNYLLYLENLGIISPSCRELVLDRSIALSSDGESIDLNTIKWIILLVLFNDPESKDSLSLLEEMVFSEGATKH